MGRFQCTYCCSSSVQLYMLTVTSLKLFTVASAIEYTPNVVYNLADETPADALVGNIAESLKPNLTNQISFILITSRKFQYFSDFFRVTHIGDLFTLKHIDRDNTNEICGPLACCKLMVCQIEASVVANVGSTEDSTMSTQDSDYKIRHLSSTIPSTQLIINLVIRINDANDNAPQFLSAIHSSYLEDGNVAKPRPFNIYLREGEASSLETLPIAIDADAQPNGIVEYRLIQISPPVSYPERSSFEVSVSKSSGISPNDKLPTEINAVQISSPKLVQTRALDYENESERKFHVVLLAIDGGTPALTGSLTIMIHLLDINDNSPSFVHSEEEVYINIPENSTLNNEPFFTARAIDADSGENGRVSYAMSPLAGADVTRKFSVDSITGEIRIRQPLDYEIYSERHFVLPLVAKDSGSPQQSSTTSLFVKVRDVNDNIPSLIVQENNTIPEGEFLKKPVMKFYIKDEDETSQGKVVCSSLNLSENHSADPELLAGQQFLRLRAVSDTVFLLFTTGVLDYESTPRISLLIECVDSTDFGDNSNIVPSEQISRHVIRITVAVEDRNDNAPIFLNEKYFARIPEHSMKGAFVSRVEAFDADNGEFGNLTYHLDHLSPGQTPTGLLTRVEQALTVDPKSGRIEVLHPNLLDRELSETFHIKVVATDKGGLSASAELVLELNDINDCAPVLIGSSEFNLEENQRIDTVIGYIHFKDNDVGKNARIHVLSNPASSGAEVHKYIRLTTDPSFQYAKSSFNNSSRLGRVGITDEDLVGDREVRAILVSQMPVDREIYATLFFEIFAFDEGDPANSVTVTITIQITDQNDNAPVLTFPLSDITVGYHPPIFVNSLTGTFVTRVRATDRDQGENGTVVFHIKSDTNGSKLFRLNETSGELTTAWIPDKGIPNVLYSTEADSVQRGMEYRRSTDTDLVRQPKPGVYLVDLIITDNGFPRHSQENRFYVNIDPANPSIPETFTTNNLDKNDVNDKLINKVPNNQLLLMLVILIAVFTAFIILAGLCWVRWCHKNKSSKDYVASPTDYNPVTSNKENSNNIAYLTSSNCGDEDCCQDAIVTDLNGLQRSSHYPIYNTTDFVATYSASLCEKFPTPLGGFDQKHNHGSYVTMHSTQSPYLQMNTKVNDYHNSSLYQTDRSNTVLGFPYSSLCPYSDALNSRVSAGTQPLSPTVAHAYPVSAITERKDSPVSRNLCKPHEFGWCKQDIIETTAHLIDSQKNKARSFSTSQERHHNYTLVRTDILPTSIIE
ncbi:Cadherin domain protein [Paragonimus heterotremus]|uniref:Cadherin domain protein n=1 Tax=Paragonimus heterotremus TaxID=100268 RepID=A0A8J4SS51_9TREM|nr:Cadherin domain protein [Paragonimus heterotremus]